ncbi:hypothetical protein [uncultured Rubinisphaera sp.]|uniref:hypothetical protein n=1 Tax=uncultured Rubinisphaera sp. TaxID=1678686 RepID=UPI0030D884F1|tara:strand:- start:930 stop:1877 length:948 start_codon:yes stop_codon:yes gene_type:complete
MSCIRIKSPEYGNVSRTLTEVPVFKANGLNTPLHNREEYVEQAYFFRTYRERLDNDLPAQEVLQVISQEILSTTQLPLAINFMASEMMLHGRVSGGMARLGHYFTPFQSFVFRQAEQDRTKFDMRIGLEILEKEAEFLALEKATPQGLFIYQFEALSRNRLGYQDGLQAMSNDPMYDEHWRDWIGKVRQSLGAIEFSEMIYSRSEYRVQEVRRRTENPDYSPSYPVLFGLQEGRIAQANRGRDPLYMFAALQRHLGYPKVPRPKPPLSERLDPIIEQRLQQLEMRLKILEAEQSGKLDLSDFYVKPEKPDFKDKD